MEAAVPIPIGGPACNAALDIDPTSGELLVMSPTLLSGYWSGDGLIEATDNKGYYHSGDRVTIDESGEYSYHGRLDRMMKCSGFRVEPAEIEAVVNAVNGVKDCVVVGIDDPASGQRPAAAVVVDPGTDAATINNQVRQHLPSYMQPVRYAFFEQLPRLSNGKLDIQRVQLGFESS